VTENGLQAGILAALDAASAAIRAQFAAAQMPPDVAGAIALANADLAPWDPAVAVRSSATAEDLPEASFAGQQDTFLNVAGYGEVMEAVKRCWASLWTARAIGYRARRGIRPEGLSLAVVVQALVPAEAEGMLFTANPLTGGRDQAISSNSLGRVVGPIWAGFAFDLNYNLPYLSGAAVMFAGFLASLAWVTQERRRPARGGLVPL
jgi:phosphoenolpyruvate synthase/pyruvate phosphate dikinase